MSTPSSSQSTAAVSSTNSNPPGIAWRASLACSIGTILSYAPIIVLTMPVLLKPISAEFGWGRATLSGALLASGIAGAIVSPWLGRAIDLWGARRFVLPGIVSFGLLVMSLSLVKSALLFYVVFGLLGITQAAAGQIAYNKVVAAWFRERRGLALGIWIGAAMSIGNGLAPQAARILSSDFGWRHTYAVLGLAVLLITLPPMLAWLREPTRSTAAPARESLEGTSARDALRTTNFWLIIAIVACFWLSISAFRVHVVALFTDRGQSELLASTALSIWSIGAFLGHIVIGYALDRFDTPRIAIPFFAMALAGLLLLDHTSVSGLTLSGAALIGLGMGAEVTLAPYFISRYFGMRSTGEIYAYVTICTGLAGAAGPYLMGISFDLFNSYRVGLNAAAIALALCIVLTALLGAYAYATRANNK